jgi:hypothetical protein
LEFIEASNRPDAEAAERGRGGEKSKKKEISIRSFFDFVDAILPQSSSSLVSLGGLGVWAVRFPRLVRRGA